jgi:hypothetical protein
MRDVALVGGVLGAGCVVVFALAAAVSMLFPAGAMVSGGYWGGGALMERSMAVPMPGLDPMVVEMPADAAEK